MNFLYSLAGTARRSVPSLLLFSLLLAPLVGCGKDEGTAEAAAEDEPLYEIGEPITDSSVAAIVTSPFGSDTLHAAEYLQQIALVESQYPQIRDDLDQHKLLERSIIEDFILRHAIFGEASNLNVAADTARVNEQLRRYRAQFGSEQEFQAMLQANNVTEDSLRASISEFVLQQQMLERYAEGAQDPTASDIEAFRQEQAQQVGARHILFSTQGVNDDSVRAVAEAVLDSIKSGADFEELAQRYSADPGSAQRGGDLGYFSRGQMVPPFEEAAFGLQDSGEVAPELVETRFGYHIIQRTGQRTGELIDTTQARALLTRQRQQEAVESALDELRGKVVVRLNPDLVRADLNESLDNL